MKNLRYKTTSVKKFMKAFESLFNRVEAKTGSKLPDNIAIVFDSWTASSGVAHFIALFEAYLMQN